MTTEECVRIEIILLAAGGSSRMAGADKLVRDIDGEPLLRRSARAAIASRAESVHVVIPPDHVPRERALDGLGVQIVASPQWREGMAASIRAGLAAASPTCDAVIIALADMPEVTAGHIDRLIGAFVSSGKRKICRAVTQDGKPGHPVLFGRQYFSALGELQGDSGARDLLRASADLVLDVATTGDGAVVDLDTPLDWQNWQKNRD